MLENCGILAVFGGIILWLGLGFLFGWGSAYLLKGKDEDWDDVTGWFVMSTMIMPIGFVIFIIALISSPFVFKHQINELQEEIEELKKKPRRRKKK